MNKDEVIVVLNSSRFGQGNPRLGEQLMKGFLEQLMDTKQLPAALLLYNSAVVLATADSPVLAEMTALRARGMDILINEESLEFYSLHPQPDTGSAATLPQMTERMLSAGTIIKP